MITLLRSAYFGRIGALAGGATYERQNQDQGDELLHGIPCKVSPCLRVIVSEVVVIRRTSLRPEVVCRYRSCPA
jgi:hypothetical protein